MTLNPGNTLFKNDFTILKASMIQIPIFVATFMQTVPSLSLPKVCAHMSLQTIDTMQSYFAQKNVELGHVLNILSNNDHAMRTWDFLPM